MSMERIHVVIADDHAIARDGVRMAIQEDPRMSVVGMVGSPAELHHMLSSVTGDVLVCDYAMPVGEGADGLNLLRSLRAEYPALAVVVLTSIEEAPILRDIAAYGVRCIVSKRDGPRHLRYAIRSAYDKRAYLSPIMKTALDAHVPDRSSGQRVKLSAREDEVIALIRQGMSMKEIAARLGISTSTASTHKANAFLKLHVTNTAELIRYSEETTAPGDVPRAS
ncbi:two-component system capsular synthesis response regulator RcsB [Luteibacter rhizovicinus]|uniref:Two-component system capsular synthesis response regulator RcsB n=1 Tax=Luteibacter rhizovicinus TaxID=242606 RepID=A0A4R3YM03_9GAMM|nr:response regulator transcription factor [Luteibacter rhizovicinus]TCV93336.1 two-component system capsular synthesis response regulator RcsB [Luteibacter rhizovicinus]